MLFSYLAFGILYKIFPSLLLLMFSSVSFGRIQKENEVVAKLGEKHISGKPKKYLRPYFFIPFGILFFSFSMFLSWLSELRTINIAFTIIFYIVSLVAEIKIIKAKKQWGVYEYGIFTKSAVAFYSEIPEIKIINNTELEFLNSDGSRDSIEIDNNTLGWLRNKFKFDSNDTYSNENWDKKRRSPTIAST